MLVKDEILEVIELMKELKLKYEEDLTINPDQKEITEHNLILVEKITTTAKQLLNKRFKC